MRLQVLLATVLCLNEIVFNFASGLTNVSISDVCGSGDKKCIWKCCHEGQHLFRRTYCRRTFYASTNWNVTLADYPVYDVAVNRLNKSLGDVFQLRYGILSDNTFANSALKVLSLFKVYIIEDGTLYLESPNSFHRWIKVSTDHFCVDNGLITGQFIILAKLEFDEGWMVINSEYALPVSIVFLVLTLVPYCVCAQLRDIDAAILATFVCFYTVTQALTLWLVVAMFTVARAIAIAVFYYFFTVSSFCWTNVMFWRLRVWSSAEYTRRSSVRQYLMYCGYTVVLPLLLSKLVAVTELVDLSHVPWLITPQIIRNGNHNFTGAESVVYLYIPLAMLLTFNWVVCVMNIITNYRTPGAALVNNNLARETPLNRPSRYVAFLVLLTLVSILQVIRCFPSLANAFLAHVIWIVQLSVGPAIFIIFVIKRNVLHSLKDWLTQTKGDTSRILFKNDDNVTIG